MQHRPWHHLKIAQNSAGELQHQGWVRWVPCQVSAAARSLAIPASQKMAATGTPLIGCLHIKSVSFHDRIQIRQWQYCLVISFWSKHRYQGCVGVCELKCVCLHVAWRVLPPACRLQCRCTVVYGTRAIRKRWSPNRVWHRQQMDLDVRHLPRWI